MHSLSRRVPDRSSVDRGREKRHYLTKLAAQFRYGEFLLAANFSGHGLVTSLGFTSDLTDACVWMTPVTKESEDVYDFQYRL